VFNTIFLGGKACTGVHVRLHEVRHLSEHAQVGEGDFFWDENGRSQFPKVAAEVDVQLTKYKQVRLAVVIAPCCKMAAEEVSMLATCTALL
jgi:hypothetical protein